MESNTDQSSESKGERFFYRYLDYTLTIENGTGVAFGEILSVPTGYVFKVERVSVYSDSTVHSKAEMFVTSPGSTRSPGFVLDRTRRMDGTLNGNDDISDEIHPICINEGLTLLTYWSNLSAGAHCFAALQISVWEKWPYPGHSHRSARLRREMEERERRVAILVPGSENWPAERQDHVPITS